MVKTEKMIAAFIFDSGRIESELYGDAVFETMLKSKELSKNNSAVVVSMGVLISAKRFVDIEPFVINDEFCTINFDKTLTDKRFEDYPFCWIAEDIEKNTVFEIDKRLKETFDAYVGACRIDVNSKQPRKQFWKEMIRSFSIKGNVITCFQDPEISDVFVYEGIAKELGYAVQYDKDAEYGCVEYSKSMQSSFVKKDGDLYVSDLKAKDIDRDILTMNFSLRHEFQISGALIWRSVCDVDKINFCCGQNGGHLVEFSFLTLYHASQGIERLQKAVIELICKKNHIKENDKKDLYDLLYRHSHEKLNAWIEKQCGVIPDANGKKLLQILTEFYNSVRYVRYSDVGCKASLTPEYDLLLSLAGGIKTDLNKTVKNNFGKYLGEMAASYCRLYEKLCSELGIFAYELEYDSEAWLVFKSRGTANLYEKFRQIRQSKKELLYWLIKNPKKFSKRDLAKAEPLNFDPQAVDGYLEELVCFPEYCKSLYDEVDCLYDELCSENKEEWKKRKELVNFVISDGDTF